MRRALWAAAGLALLAVLSWGSASPVEAMAISAPAALKSAADGIAVTETVQCWNCGYYRPHRFYGPRYYGYDRPRYYGYDRPRNYGYGPRYYRPYRHDYGGYQPYGGYRPSYYGGYRPYYGGYNSPYRRHYYYFGPNIYSF